MRRARLAALLTTIRLDPRFFLADIRLARRAQQERHAIQKGSELACLIALVRPRAPRAVLEVGSERGGTFWVWAQIAREDALLISLDWPQVALKPLVTVPELKRMRRSERQSVHAVRADSHAQTTREEVERILDRPLDLLFLDGDHSYAGVRRDFELYSPLVALGGLVAFHDIAEHPAKAESEVDRFWRKLDGRGRRWEFIDPEGDLGAGAWGGIGVLELSECSRTPASAYA